MAVIYLRVVLIMVLIHHVICDSYCVYSATGCTHKCHCGANDRANCNRDTGRCNDGHCSPGWIGESCQYSNIAYQKHLSPPEITDGNDSTCKFGSNFTVDLTKSYQISSFEIVTSPRDGMPLTVMIAFVKSSPLEQDGLNNTCIQSPSIFEITQVYSCTHTIFGQYLVLRFNQQISVCEIKIHGGQNVALWQQTKQSGTYENYWASKAVDGYVGNNRLTSGFCSHASTFGDYVHPYWTVSFGQNLIQRVKIYFRDDQLLWRGNDFEFIIRDDNNITFTKNTNGQPSREEEFIFPISVLGSNLTISLPGDQDSSHNLQLCEVQVFACKFGPNGGSSCTNSCPRNCITNDNDYRCVNFECPENKCMGDWKGKYCTQKQCNLSRSGLNDLYLSPVNWKKTPYLSGETLTVKCIQGYKQQGTGTIQCGADGNWNFNVNCTGISLFCIRMNSPSLKCVDYTKTRYALTWLFYNGISPNLPQRTFESKNKRSLIRYRILANKCSVPSNIDEHLIFGSKKINFNNTIVLACARGYKLHGSNKIYCNFDGQWYQTLNKQSHSCTVNKCRFPEVIDPHLNINNNINESVLFDTTIRLSCLKGYLSGPKQIKCKPDGQWDVIVNSSSPVCVKEPASQSFPIAAVGSGVGAAVVVITVLVIVLIFLRRKRSKESRNKPYDEINKVDENIRYSNMESRANSVSEITLPKENDEINEQNTYYAFLPKDKLSKTSIDVDKFKDYIEENKGREGPIMLQFLDLTSGLKLPATAALSQQNRMKNKYKNICAYDDTRVVLKRNKQQSKSDYTNASYINGFESVRRYVASQAPIKGTEEDFWEMIFQLGSDKIVMLTNLIEEGKQKCEQYWPDTGEIRFGDMNIRLRSIDRYADFTIRNLSISQGDSPWKDVRQFHFTSWPDRGVPKYASSLVQFRSKVLTAPTKGKGPLVVHCSAGVGRTGTFIALDYLVSQANTVGQVDVFACVETLRRQRVNMVQTSEQYLFLHFALEEAVICKASAPATAEFPNVYSSLQKFFPIEKKRGIDKELETLNETSPKYQEDDFVSGKAAENKMKNRYSNILPVESHRIYLYTHASGRSDYINAVMLPGYRENNAFIVTQMPLKDTIIDFCRLVYENDVSSIVMLNEITEETMLGQYWPNNTKTVEFGDFILENTKEEILENVVINHISIQYESQEPRKIKQFQVKFWPDAAQKPRSAKELLDLMELVHLWQRNTGNNPVIVHCMNGCDKSGLYCVIEATIERLKIEQDVGIQQTIKQMRSRRPQIIPNIEQYEFCHEAVLEYLEQYETYSNFQ